MGAENSSLEEPSQTQEWFLGLDKAAERRLFPSEATALRRRITRLKMRPLIIIVTAAVSLPILFFALNFASAHSQLMDNIASVVAISLIFLGLPVLILLSRDCFREAGILRRDLQDGRAFLFQGHVGEPWQDGKAFRGLLKEGLIQPEGDAPHNLDVLPFSGLVIAANGAHPKGWWRGNVVEATALPRQQYAVHMNQDGAVVDLGERFEMLQRHMSEGELEELRYHLSRIMRPPFLLVVLVVWMLVLCAAMILHASEGQLGPWFQTYKTQIIMLPAFFSISAYYYIRGRRVARLVHKDLSLGTLKIFRLKEGCGPATQEGCPSELELLPVSSMVWNVDGKPGTWRLRRHGSKGFK